MRNSSMKLMKALEKFMRACVCWELISKRKCSKSSTDLSFIIQSECYWMCCTSCKGMTPKATAVLVSAATVGVGSNLLCCMVYIASCLFWTNCS